jgi:hypothetical protein
MEAFDRIVHVLHELVRVAARRETVLVDTAHGGVL